MAVNKRIGESGIVEEGISNFMSNRFNAAKSYFTVSLAMDANNRIAKFGLMCIDAINDGFVEAIDLFKLFLFSPEEEQEAILEAFISAETIVIDDVSEFAHEEVLSSRSRGEVAEFIDEETIEKDAFDSFMLLGKLYKKLKNLDKAIDQFLRAYQIRPFDKRVISELVNTIKKKDGE